jgi:hypothetical protein
MNVSPGLTSQENTRSFTNRAFRLTQNDWSRVSRMSLTVPASWNPSRGVSEETETSTVCGQVAMSSTLCGLNTIWAI